MYFLRMMRGGLLAAMAISTLSAGVITEALFSSNGGSFINDTIADGVTAPLGFTNTGGTADAFLNNANSTITGLAYGSYYAITFLGFGQHIGTGTFSVRHDGVLFSTAVTFPSDLTCCTQFASLSLPGGDSVTLATTDLSADRIAIIADGAGLTPGGAADAFYLFTFTQGAAVPEPGSAVLLATAVFALGFARFRKR